MFHSLTSSNASKSNSNSVDAQQSTFAIINNDRLTPAQKSAYAFDKGICVSCGIKTHWVGPFKRRPYTNERVLQGVCRTCEPGKCRELELATSNSHSHSNSKLPGGVRQLLPFKGHAVDEMSKLVVPPDVLLSKTTSTLSQLQSSMTQSANKLGESIKETSNSVNKSIQETSQRMDQYQRSASRNMNMNVFGSARMTQSEQQRQASKPKSHFANLEHKFESTATIEQFQDEPSVNSWSTSETFKSNNNNNFQGMVVSTPFGTGQVVDYREQDQMYVIHLHRNVENDNNSNPTKQDNQNNSTNMKKKNLTKLFCKKESFSATTTTTSTEDENESTAKRQKRAMEINEAYEALEKMRRLNLEVECEEHGIACVDFNQCTTCLLQSGNSHPNQPSIFHKLVHDQKKKIVSPCLFCAAPACVTHSDPTFRKEGITACLECVKLFDSDYIVDCVNQAHGVLATKHTDNNHQSHYQQRPIDHMMDLYDRVLLLLQYSSQYIDSIATALEANTKKNNNINVGSSSVGIVSGALGVAAAAAIFTPAGPPLLVASLMLGGGATAVQTGTEVVNYYSEPNKFADKIIALMGMMHSILQVKETLREVLTARLLQEQGNPEIDRLKQSLQDLRTKQRSAAIKAGTTVASTAVLGGVAMGTAEVAAGAAAVESAALVSTVEVGAVAGRQASMLSKSGTAIARGARFARFAGGALSAATLVLEAKTMSSTLQQIRAGNPCEKADTLRRIAQEFPLLPTTEQLDEECRIYIGAMSNRVNATSLEDAIKLIENKAIAEWQAEKQKYQDLQSLNGVDSEMAPAGVSILDGEGGGDASNDTTDDLALWESSLKEAVQEERMAQSLSGLPPTTIDIADNAISNEANPNEASSTKSLPSRMTQSMTHLPPTTTTSGTNESPTSQSTLLERIQKFKQEESFHSAGSS